MKNRSSVRSVRALAPAELLFLICLLIPGSLALSQPFPSFMLDSTIGHVPPFADIGFTRVAFGPEVGLATWGEDDRLLAARIDSRGVLLDTVPIDMGGSSGRTGVAWGGGRFLVAWTKQVSMAPDLTECALVDTSGQVVWRRVLQDSVKQGMSAAAAFDGTNFLVAWIARNEADTFTVYFSRISPEGVVLDSPPRIAAPHAPIEQYDIALCFHEDRYLAVWNHYDTGGLWASWILPDGTVPDSVGFPIRNGAATDYPAVTHDRGNFVVSWNESPYQTRVARVTDGGQVLDTAGVVVDTNSLCESAVCSTGETTLVVYFSDPFWGFDSLRPMAVLVDTALRTMGAPVALAWPGNGHVYGNGPTALAAATAGDSFIVTWAQPARDISVQATCLAWFRRLNQQGQLLDTAPVPMSFGANTQWLPDVASNGTDFLAVWVDQRYDSANLTQPIVGRRFSAEGVLLDSQPILVGGTRARRPALAFGGGCYLAVWYDDRGLSAIRISATGILLDSLPIRIIDPDRHWPVQDIAYGDSLFLVVWTTLDAPQVHGVRIAPSGAVLDSTPLLLQADTLTGSGFAQVAFDGTNFLVSRHDAVPDPDEFRFVRVSTVGQLLDTIDPVVTTSNDGNARLDLAFGDGVYGVVDNQRGYFWRVSPGGSVLGPVPHAYSGFAEVAYDGTDFMLLCDMRDSSGRTTNRLGALRITPDGRVLDMAPFVLLTADSGRVSAADAALAANSAGRVAVVAQSYEPAPYGVCRIRAATFPAIVGIGSQPGDGRGAALHVHPNPASRLASLSFNLTQAGPVRVTAFDVTGRRCASLFSGRMKAGRQTLPLDTRRLANGIYFLRLEAGAATHSIRLVVSR